MSTAPEYYSLPNAPVFTKEEAAAIALRVPESGNEWLDKMIRTAQRNELEGRIASGLASATREDGTWNFRPDDVAEHARLIADAMLSGAATPTGEV